MLTVIVLQNCWTSFVVEFLTLQHFLPDFDLKKKLFLANKRQILLVKLCFSLHFIPLDPDPDPRIQMNPDPDPHFRF